MPHRDTFAIERVFGFSDGVFAIAITLLAIELKVPVIDGPITDTAILDALQHALPHFIGFVVSFYLIGQSWIEHHRIGRKLARADQGLLWRNTVTLLFVSLLPFVTAFVSSYPTSRIAVVSYAAVFAGLGASKAMLWHYAVRVGLVKRDDEHIVIARRLWAQPVTALGVMILGGAGISFAFVGFAMLPLFNARITEMAQLATTTAEA